MIDLTPLEVRKKKGDFRRGLRGYEPDEVDTFLELVADRLEELVRENRSLQESVRRTEEQVAEYRERERALTDALVSAQEYREQAREQAEREAALRLREAEAEATRLQAEARRELAREEEGLRRIRTRRVQLMESFRAFLERELTEVTHEIDALHRQDEPGLAGARRGGERPPYVLLEGEDEAPPPEGGRRGRKGEAEPRLSELVEGEP
ncbi:MAG TPA: DivIVA domain-containing protein [Longimicrobiales bacterium]|nr:DivIVA domain-containing protein [Longimicrobiales bacterium]